MSELEDKLGAFLSNPQLMQQVAAMAQALSSPGKAQAQSPAPKPEPTDPGVLPNLTGLLQPNQISTEQEHLLLALKPYLNQMRIRKLERAMLAAKMAGFAASMMKNADPRFSGGR